MKIERHKPIRLGELKIPHIEIEEFSFEPTGYDIRLHHQFMHIVLKTEYGSELKKLLLDDPKIKELEGQTIAQAQSSHPFNIDIFTCWVIWRVNLVGGEQAQLDLNNYLNNDTVETVYTLWILGIEIQETIELLDDVKIIPIDDMPNSTYKEKFSQHKIGHVIPHFLPNPNCAIVTTVLEKKSNKLNTNHDAHSKIQNISLLLNLVDNTSCLPYFNTVEVSEKTPIGPFGGHGGSSTVYDVVGNMTTKLSADDFTEVQSLFEKFSKFSDEEQSRFSIIINRIRQAKRRNSIEDKILDLVIALEMMLLEDNDKSQLKLQFRLRGSLLISETDNEKINYFTTFGKLYDYRSSVAHSGMLKDKDRKTIQEKFPEFCNLTEKVCKTLILQGSPKWDDLVLGIKDIEEDGVAL